jgi:hypothetical protein
MDIQKLEQIVLNDVKTEAQNLIKQTRKEMEHWLTEQSNVVKEENGRELERIKADHKSKLSIIRASLATEYSKNLGKAKKEKISILSRELINTLLQKIKQSPDWILEKAFLEVPIKSAKLRISEDLSPYFNQEKAELYLKNKPGFTWGGFDKDLNLGLSFESNTIRYIFQLQEIIDEFLDTQSEKIVNLLFP